MLKLTLWQRLAITATVRKEWYLALSKVAGDGLPIFDALERMAADFRKTSHALAPLVQLLLLRLRGAGASKATMQRRTLGTELAGMMPDDEVMLIQAGDTSGKIADGLRNAAKLVMTKGVLKASIMDGLRKPVGYLLGMVGLLFFMATRIIPQFERSKPRAAWPERAQLLGAVADHVFWIGGGVLGFLLLTALLLRVVVPNWRGEARDRLDRVLFPFNVIAAMNGASFLTSLSGYIGAGTAFNDAVKSMQTSATPYMQYQCGRVLGAMKRGRKPEEALCELAIVPPRFHWIINVYAMSGDTEQAYVAISEQMVLGVQAFVTRIFNYILGNLLLVSIVYMCFWIYQSMSDIALSGTRL